MLIEQVNEYYFEVHIDEQERQDLMQTVFMMNLETVRELDELFCFLISEAVANRFVHIHPDMQYNESGITIRETHKPKFTQPDQLRTKMHELAKLKRAAPIKIMETYCADIENSAKNCCSRTESESRYIRLMDLQKTGPRMPDRKDSAQSIINAVLKKGVNRVINKPGK